MKREPGSVPPPMPVGWPVVDGAIFGIGVDAVRIARIERVLAAHPERFMQRILCRQEREEVMARRDRVRAMAMCFAAKEAFVKALGTGFRGVGHRDAGVVRDGNGKPLLIFSEALQARLAIAGAGNAHVSLTDDDGWACAFVVLERAAAS